MSDTASESPGPSPGLFEVLKRLWRTVRATAYNRLELLLVEVEEERRRAMQVVLLTLVVAILALMTLLVVTLTIVYVFWDEHALAALLTTSALYLLATVGVGWKLYRVIDHRPAFAATLAELQKDKAWADENK